jgi:hypothetical protein
VRRVWRVGNTAVTSGQPTIVASRPASPYDLYWQQRANELALQSLPSIRSSAKQWAATIGALTGVFSIAALIKGRSNVADIAAGWSTFVGVAVAVALLAAVVAVTEAALAGQGSPIEMEISGTAARGLLRSEAKTAAKQLRLSRFFTLIATLLIGVAVGALWYAPARTIAIAQPLTLVVRTAHGSICGRLRSSSFPGLEITAGGATIDLPAAQISSFSQVAHC